MERYLLIDPTGISLVVQPEASIALQSNQVDGGRTIDGGKVIGASLQRYEFETPITLGQSDYDRLAGFVRSQETLGYPRETVVYQLFSRVSDFGARTREIVPDIDAIVEQGYIKYYPVIQGFLSLTEPVLSGHSEGQPVWKLTLGFSEGTVRLNNA